MDWHRLFDLINQEAASGIVGSSVSRLLRQLCNSADAETAAQVLKALSVYNASRDLIEVGAYRPGVNAELDQAVRLAPHLDRFLAQPPGVAVSRHEAIQQLRAVMAGKK